MKGNRRYPLPKLSYGEGTMTYSESGTIEYRKYIHLKDGSRMRKTIRAATVAECFKKMEKEERRLQQANSKKKESQILIDTMLYWLQTVKKNTLKQQSYKRLESLIYTHIDSSMLGHMRISMIRPNDLQEFVNRFNNGEYSYSTIKKVYDCFNDFFRYLSIRDHISNPMETVTCVTKQNVIKDNKMIEYLDSEDLKIFKKEALRCWKSSGKMRYRYGHVIVANLYLGLRIGELLALKWKDIDFSNGYINVTKTLVQIDNPIYDRSQMKEMKRKDIKKNLFVIQDSTKTNKNRKVPMNKTAKQQLLQHFEQSNFKNPDDFVIATRTGKSSTPKNIQSTLRCILKNSRTKVRSSNTHIMRHTCASLLFHNGVDLHTISRILGNSEEVLRKTYVHFDEGELSSVMELIDDIE